MGSRDSIDRRRSAARTRMSWRTFGAAIALVFAPPGSSTGPLSGAVGEALAGPGRPCVGERCCDRNPAQITGTAEAETLVGSRADNCVLGRAGGDRIEGGGGGDFIVPGSGADDVYGGPGDDVVVVYDVCELERGEVLRGGGGRDTLVLPIAFDDLAALGVRARGFESVVVDRGSRCHADCRLPCSRVPDELRGVGNPTAWSVDPLGGARWRRATRSERQRNRWDRGTFLIEAGPLVTAVTRGDPRATVLVPLPDGTVRHADLELRSRRGGLDFIERRFTTRGLVSRTLRPMLYEYVSAGLDPDRPAPVAGAWLGLLAGDDGGVYGYGLVDGVEIAIDAPNPGWSLDEIGAPGGPPVDARDVARVSVLKLGPYGLQQHDGCSNGLAFTCEWLCAEIPGLPCDHNTNLDPPASGHHCVDEEDNDDDARTDSGDEDCAHHPSPFHASQAVRDATWGCDMHSGSHTHRWESGKSFAMFGEGRFCTQYATAVDDPDGDETGNWIQRLTRVGWDAAAFLEDAAFSSGFPGGEDEVRYVAGGCWIFPSFAAAETCANGGACDVPDSAEYPYAGAGSSASGHYDAVWDDVEHGASHGLNDPLHLAQVVYWGGTEDAPYPLDCAAQEGAGCCGAAPTGSPTNDFDDLGVDQRGSSVMMYNANLCNPRIVASHEIGHSMGLDHDAIYGPCGAGGGNACKGFMHETGGAIPLLTAGNQAQLDGCRLAWDCPRPSGFRFHEEP